jgi:hypothetical protein
MNQDESPPVESSTEAVVWRDRYLGLVALLPRCVHIQDLETNARSCPRVATKGPQDAEEDFFGDLWCDEHAPTDRDIEDCNWLEDLPWAYQAREHGELALQNRSR